MGFGHKRADLRANAQEKINDAVILWNNGKYSNAYYLAGYAVEIGLKACIAAQVSAETVPDKDFMKDFFNHQFLTLIGRAGLMTQLQNQKNADPDFAANWALISEWRPDARYDMTDVTSAQAIISAINDPTSGVLTWIKTYW